MGDDCEPQLLLSIDSNLLAGPRATRRQQRLQ